jgi:hypothetical protein
MSDLTSALTDFVTYVTTHLTGDEKGEAADFWSVPLKNWTGNKLDLEPHFRHLIGKGGTQ